MEKEQKKNKIRELAQATGHFINTSSTFLANKYKDYQAKAPEREARRKEKVQSKIDMMKEKVELARQERLLAREQGKLRREREISHPMPNPNQMMNVGLGMGSMGRIPRGRIAPAQNRRFKQPPETIF